MDGQPRAMLVVSALAGDEEPRVQGLRELAESYGPLAFLSSCLPFELTEYYAREMGSPLTRRVAAFCDPLEQHRLAEVKAVCQDLERRFSVGERRRVNLDPGLITTGSLILASSKPSPHRVVLSPGIQAEVTMLYNHGVWISLPWTYPDYASPPLSEILLVLRRRYLWQLAQWRAKEGASCSNP